MQNVGDLLSVQVHEGQNDPRSSDSQSHELDHDHPSEGASGRFRALHDKNDIFLGPVIARAKIVEIENQR